MTPEEKDERARDILDNMLSGMTPEDIEREKEFPRPTEENLNRYFAKFLEIYGYGNQAMPDPKKKPDDKNDKNDKADKVDKVEPKSELDKFTPYNTIFKLNELSLKTTDVAGDCLVCGPRFVECIACSWGCELESLLLGEVSEWQCPDCKMTVWEYYEDKPHQKAPDDG